MSGAFSPFCSRRCKLIDLGKWLSEEHAISESLPPEQAGKYAGLSGKTPADPQDSRPGPDAA
jgi:endogenous inhibitor of DNA gyrase (YacG/DUF329 family)